VPLATYILQAKPEETKPWIVPVIHRIRNDDLRFVMLQDEHSLMSLDVSLSQAVTLMMPLKLLHAFTYIFNHRILILAFVVNYF
jgi:hypothetical protein